MLTLVVFHLYCGIFFCVNHKNSNIASEIWPDK